jgi:hypothetical protein
VLAKVYSWAGIGLEAALVEIEVDTAEVTVGWTMDAECAYASRE